jgi:RNA polymerase sigma factor (sigma-70 family)
MATALSVTQPAPACTEHELVAAVRRGSDRAFEELFARYRARIGSYVFGMVGDHAHAEDIAQEVFISALRRLRETERPIAFKPWLYEIAKNACIDEFRRTKRAAREVPLAGEEDDSPGPVLAGGTTPDAAVENKQRLDNLRGAFQGLSENHHRILVMRELEGLSYSQIGTQLEMSRAEVESTLFRARRKLGEEYSELVTGRRCERVQSVIEAGGERPLRSLGLRDRRQLARHLAHCQPCRRHARMAGVDDSFFQTPGLIGKIAALLPFPWLRWRRSRGDEDQVAASAGHQLVALQSLPVLARFADGSPPMFGMGRATAAAAALLIAGAGGGLVAGLGSHAPAPTHHVTAPAPRTSAVPTIHIARASARPAPSRARAAKLSGGHGGGGGGSAPSATSASNLASSGGHSSGGSGSPLSKTVGSVGSTLNNLGSAASGTSSTLSKVSSSAGNTVTQVTQQAGSTVSQVSQQADSTVSQVSQQAGSTVNQVSQQAGNTVNQVTQPTGSTVNQVTQQAGSTVGNVTNTATGTVNNVTSGAGSTLGSLTGH